jgi:hypothetical protein
VVIRRAADEFVLSVGFADEAGAAESGNGGVLKPEPIDG